MGNLMAGLALELLGVVFLFTSSLIYRYPAQGQVRFPWPYYALRYGSFFLFPAGVVLLIAGFL